MLVLFWYVGEVCVCVRVCMCAVSDECLYECNIYVHMSVSLHAPFKENAYNHSCIISNDTDV